MALQYSDEPLDLQLFRDDDDEEDVLYKKRLFALMNGNVTPSEAAAAFDAWVVDEANTRLKELMKRPDPRNLTSEDEERGIVSMRAIAPNPSGNIELVFPSIAKLCSAFPPHHPGQDRIIQFLEALRAMPEHQVPEGVPAEDRNDHYEMTTLWPFGGNWMALAEVFRREAYEYSYPYSDIETPGSETQLRWRNWQSAIARITTSGLIDCGFLCALGDILPSSNNYPDLEKRKIGGPNRVSGDVIAGAQWIIWPDEGRFVYEQCKKVDKVDGPRTMWSMERWGMWKDQLAFVAGDERFNSEARLVAKLAGQRMVAIEGET
ncbi:hypothetical protein SERLA73DRAFT_185094 [Serpula lacrymans var. lacrymans S7.3]|uniref:Uncharacterized protein n=2 Tax=Serpula lacrymans var. lacrymans TaxID=341189 RepID=F8Q422_SERL3|nr:uncharacterized protein SERLADRAFT_473348 [Serpula lacrymans var. lacrymans S7.9]EGN96878.1 hypothetical protein SERLA73DRAFT_185094 [Serpula lacrymans var. lacrymans S7.3]EGO22477.1 hypothetical protein SERLADRAFT_473348 [Serpula lacrymans var. lacrymans S7.9]